MKCKFVNILVIVSILLTSCLKKEEPVLCDSNSNNGQKMLILNEGLFQQNNSSFTQINIATGGTFQNYFQEIAGRPLGDTGNDIKRYGGKIYVVVNVSSTIEVIDAQTMESIEQIEMKNGGVSKQPRYIDFSGSNAFVTCYDGFVDVIDTNSLLVTQRIQVGSNPDQLKVAGDKIYVSNSGGLNFPNYDSTVSVISTSSLSEVKKITVGLNPGSIQIGGNGDVYVVSRGDFDLVPSRLNRIETIGDTKTETYSFDVSAITEMNGDLLVFNSDGVPTLNVFNVNVNGLSNTGLIDLSTLATPYDVYYESSIDRIYVMDANGYVNAGSVLEYSGSGGFIGEYNAGLVPTGVVFL